MIAGSGDDDADSSVTSGAVSEDLSNYSSSVETTPPPVADEERSERPRIQSPGAGGVFAGAFRKPNVETVPEFDPLADKYGRFMSQVSDDSAAGHVDLRMVSPDERSILFYDRDATEIAAEAMAVLDSTIQNCASHPARAIRVHGHATPGETNRAGMLELAAYRAIEVGLALVNDPRCNSPVYLSTYGSAPPTVPQAPDDLQNRFVDILFEY